MLHWFLFLNFRKKDGQIWFRQIFWISYVKLYFERRKSKRNRSDVKRNVNRNENRCDVNRKFHVLTLRHNFPFNLRNQWPPPKVYEPEINIYLNRTVNVLANCKRFKVKKSFSQDNWLSYWWTNRANDKQVKIWCKRQRSQQQNTSDDVQCRTEACVRRAWRYDTTFICE